MKKEWQRKTILKVSVLLFAVNKARMTAYKKCVTTLHSDTWQYRTRTIIIDIIFCSLSNKSSTQYEAHGAWDIATIFTGPHTSKQASTEDLRLNQDWIKVTRKKWFIRWVALIYHKWRVFGRYHCGRTHKKKEKSEKCVLKPPQLIKFGCKNGDIKYALQL